MDNEYKKMIIRYQEIQGMKKIDMTLINLN